MIIQGVVRVEGNGGVRFEEDVRSLLVDDEADFAAKVIANEEWTGR